MVVLWTEMFSEWTVRIIMSHFYFYF
jgi:hypothetical protein